MATSRRSSLLALCLGLLIPGLLRGEPPFSLFDSLPPNTTPTPAAAGGLLFTHFDFPYDLDAPGGADDRAGADRRRPRERSIEGNPAATNLQLGTGTLGELLRVDPYGIRVGGIWFYDQTINFLGGVKPGGWAGEEMFTAEIALDLDRLYGWRGGILAADVLQHNGSPAGDLTGDVMSFEGLDGGPPLVRTELYQLWFLQKFCNDRFAVLIGKLVPTFQFANISAATELIGTPIFTMPTMLGRLPGYPDSACGVTVEAFPTDSSYGYFGFYDGRLGGSGTPTGLLGPQFNGQYFYIGEVGARYTLGGAHRLEGKAGVGYWYQSGPLLRFDGAIQLGMSGWYAIATQELWNVNPGVDSQGLVAFFQFGSADPNLQYVQTYLGAGLDWRGPLRHRPRDAAGIGLFWGDLTNAPGAGNPPANETTVQTYYQAILSKNLFVQPVLTYIHDPGSNRDLASPLALTLRVGLVF